MPESRRRTLSARYSKRKGRLEVQWRNGSWTSYLGVSPNVSVGFRSAERAGQYVDDGLAAFPSAPGGGDSLTFE
jgi:hypothetical protein